MAQADIDGAHLAFEESGQGESLVLVHGSASDRRAWHLQEQAFAERFRVVSFSRRYHWPNEAIREGVDYSMGQHVDDLRSLVLALDAAPAHLVGHSYGAFLCLLLAIRHPSLVRTLVLAEPPVITLFVSPNPAPFELLKLAVTRPRTAAGIVKLGARGIDPARQAFERNDLQGGVRTFIDAVLGRGAYERLSPSHKAQVQDNIISLKAELLGSGFLKVEAGQVQRVQAPTLLVTGGLSAGLFHRLTDRLEELLPGSERIEIPGATHMMQEDNAPAFNAAALSFLGKHLRAA